MEYNKEDWISFIEDNLTNDLQTEHLAARFNISKTHFKRLFRREFGMTVSDYVRKRRIVAVAELIRTGRNYMRTAARYGYRSHGGIMRAFLKEYLVTPAAYKDGEISEILMQDGETGCSRIQIGIFQVLPLKIEAFAIFHCREREEEKVDSFWMEEGFPSQPSSRLECNKEIRDDKVAFWYPDEDGNGFNYMAGDVVKKFGEELNQECFKIVVPAGKYAIFQTDCITDKSRFMTVRKLFRKMVKEQWMKENEEQIDGSRISFERYVNQKMYVFVPMKKYNLIND